MPYFSDQALKRTTSSSFAANSTSGTTKVRKQFRPHYSTNEDDNDLSSLNPSDLNVDKTDMEWMLADLSLTNFSSISDEAEPAWSHSEPLLNEKTSSKSIPQFNLTKQLPLRKDCHFYIDPIHAINL